MRVQGNRVPEAIHLEPCWARPGWVELRLRENLAEITGADEMTGQSYTMYVYDEYTFTLKDAEGLREQVESDLANWLATGRAMEVDQRASILADARDFEAQLREIINE